MQNIKKKTLVITLSALALLCSCGKKKPTVQEIRETYTKPIEMEINKQDSMDVINLTNEFLSYLKEKDTDRALEMVYYLKGDTIKPLPEGLAARERSVLKILEQSVKFEVKELQFLKEKDNRVQIVATLFEKDPNDPAPNTMQFVLRPVRREGVWFLTLADSESDTNHGSEIER